MTSDPEELDRQTVVDCAAYLSRLVKEGRVVVVAPSGPRLSIAYPCCWHDGRGRLVIAVTALEPEAVDNLEEGT